MAISEEATKNVQAWLVGPYDLTTKSQIRKMVEQDPIGAENAFYTNLGFGTGGMRGLMGVGPNRMNIYTVRQTTKGLANYLKKQFGKGVLRVVIGFDSRNNSQLFALEAARVLAAASIEVFLFKELRPTPEVSFACQHLKCHAGIMFTASHNPPEYNGYKVYWQDGGQVISPHDKGITAEVQQALGAGSINVAPEGDPFIHHIAQEVDEPYLASLRSLVLVPEPLPADKGSLSVLYSCLHGTGGTLVPRALRQIGISNLHFVAEQMAPDGNFPTAHSPNPEEPAALQLGVAKMLQEGIDLFLATDPDADRLGAVVNHHGEPYILTGNQIASLAVEWIFRQRSARGLHVPRPAVIKTIVTTPLVQKIAESWGATCFNVLTGFKYIAQLMNEWESSAAPFQYVFGCEESYGYLYGTHARDKDAVGCSCLLSEIAWILKCEGKTLVDALRDIWGKYGYFDESLLTCPFEESKSGRERMGAVMRNLRALPPQQFGEMRTVACEDLLQALYSGDPAYRVGAGLPKADVLIFSLEDGSRIIVRPSGTEPKVKVYVMTASIPGPSLEDVQRQTKEKAERFRLCVRGLFQ